MVLKHKIHRHDGTVWHRLLSVSATVTKLMALRRGRRFKGDFHVCCRLANVYQGTLIAAKALTTCVGKWEKIPLLWPNTFPQI